MVTIPATQLRLFQQTVWPVVKDKQRVGQAFYDHMKLEKLTDPEDIAWADRLYSASDDSSAKLILDRLDWDN